MEHQTEVRKDLGFFFFTQNTKLFFDKVLTKLSFRDILCKYERFAPLAQPVEHMTFNHGVRSSILRWSTRPRFARTSVFSFSKRRCDRRNVF